VGTATPPDCWSSSAHADMASSLAKRLCGTPERIELENYKPCPQQQDSPLQEVPEETLAQHNLSASLLEKNTEEQSRYPKHTLVMLLMFTDMFGPGKYVSFLVFSSSESDLEEEELAWKKGEGLPSRTNGERELDLGEGLKDEEGGENQEKQEEEEEEEVSEEEYEEGVSSDGERIFIFNIFRND